MARVWKFLRKAFMIEFLLVKLQTYSVQNATLLLRELTKDTFWNMYGKLAILKKANKVATL